MKRHFHIYVLGISLLLLESCFTPMPVLRQSPYEEEGTWFQGLEYVVLNGEGSQMAIAFSGIENRDIIYDVEIENVSEESYLVDPADFHGVAIPFEADHFFWEKPGGTLQEEQKVYAYDPEEVLLDLDKGIARIDAERRNNTAASIIVGLAAIGAAAAVSASSSSDVGNSDAVANDSFIWIDNNDNGAAEADLRQNKAYWQSALLRKTTLTPGQKVRGLVYFTSNPDAKFNYLYFPLGDETLQITFLQKRIDSRGPKINGLDN